MEPLSLNKKLGMIAAVLVIAVVGSPFIYAAVEPHIILTMDASQTTAPFTINNNTGYEMFSVKPDGSVNNVIGISTSLDSTVISVTAANTISNPIILEQYYFTGRTTYHDNEYHIISIEPFGSAIVKRDSGVGSCQGGWFQQVGGSSTWNNQRTSFGTSSATYTHLTHFGGSAWLEGDVDSLGYIVYNTDGATTCSMHSMTSYHELILPGDITMTRGI